jgi:hypothetical protein
MKHPAFIVLAIVACLGLFSAAAADSPLEILSARQELEDFIRGTNTRLRDLEEGMQAQQKRILALEDENQKLRIDLLRLSRSNPTAGFEESLKQLAQDIKEVDRKRLADNKLTLEKLSDLERSIRTRPTPSPPPPDTGRKIDPKAELFKYSVQKGDSLLRIVSKLRAQGNQVTQKAIEDANPGVAWNRLQIGQEIYVPVSKN